jgi:hypothetical protein
MTLSKKELLRTHAEPRPLGRFDLPNSKWQAEVEAARLVEHISSLDVATVNDTTSLTVNPKTDIEQWRELVRTLYSEGVRLERVDTCIKFMFGDAIIQGEQIYGEDHNQVFNVDVHWSYNTVQNIVRVVRLVPPKIRDCTLAFHLYTELASAAFTVDQIKYYLDMARRLRDEGEQHFRKPVLQLANNDKIDQMLQYMKKDEQRKWMDVSNRLSPHWRKLKKMIAGEMAIPDTPVRLGAYVMRLAADTLDSWEEFPVEKEDARKLITECLFEMHKDIKSGNIKEE